MEWALGDCQRVVGTETAEEIAGEAEQSTHALEMCRVLLSSGFALTTEIKAAKGGGCLRVTGDELLSQNDSAYLIYY